MPEHKTCFVLPPFAIDYPENPFKDLPGYPRYLKESLDHAASFADPELSGFDFIACNFLEDELRSQYMAYIISCSLADFLKDHHKTPAFTAGYSMGLYASLYQSGAITFDAGLEIITNAFSAIKKVTNREKYGMGSITGLNREDIHQVCVENGLNLEIGIQNSVCSFIVSGLSSEVEMMLEKSRFEGALNTRILNVSIPYHSSLLKIVSGPFGKFINHQPFDHPVIPVISLIDQKILKDQKEIREEIIRNIHTPLNWYKTQLFLQEQKVDTFVECGPGKTLVKNARFIEGDALFLNANAYFSTEN